MATDNSRAMDSNKAMASSKATISNKAATDSSNNMATRDIARLRTRWTVATLVRLIYKEKNSAETNYPQAPVSSWLPSPRTARPSAAATPMPS